MKAVLINCLIPNVSLKSLRVQSFHKMKSIADAIGRDVTLIYNGQVVLPQMTVGFYNVQDGDCFVVANSRKMNEIAIWKKITKTRKDIMNKLCGINAVNKEKEAVRLNDIKLLKMEMNPKSYRKQINKLLNAKENVNCNKDETIYHKPYSICSNALPAFWKLQKTQETRKIEEKDENLDFTERKDDRALIE